MGDALRQVEAQFGKTIEARCELDGSGALSLSVYPLGEEHLTRSSRDLTLVQTARMSLRDAVQRAEQRVRGGFVFWAIPTLRDSRAGYGVYVLDRRNVVHYLFIS